MPSSRVRLEDLALRIARPQRVLGLQRRDRMHRVRAADASPAHARGGRAAAPCPAFTSSAMAPTVSSIGACGIDAVLVVEVDRRRCRAATGSPRTPASRSRACRRRPGTTRPRRARSANLVATTASFAPRAVSACPTQLLVARPTRTRPRCREGRCPCRARGGSPSIERLLSRARRTRSCPCSRGRSPGSGVRSVRACASSSRSTSGRSCTARGGRVKIAGCGFPA